MKQIDLADIEKRPSPNENSPDNQHKGAGNGDSRSSKLSHRTSNSGMPVRFYFKSMTQSMYSQNLNI
jgi:hypothetical protein